jgi:hypothetical protein
MFAAKGDLHLVPPGVELVLDEFAKDVGRRVPDYDLFHHAGADCGLEAIGYRI